MRKWGTFLIFFAALLWATDAPFRVHLTKDLSSNFIVLGEHFFDVLVVLPMLWVLRKDLKTLSAKDWLAVLFIAIGGSALASVFFTKAFAYVNPSVAILLQKLQPLLAIGLAAGVLKEKLTPRFWLWAALALFGAYLISFGHLRPQAYPGEQYSANTTGILLALLAAALWGASTVWGRYVLNHTNFKVMTGLRFVLAFVFLVILNFWQHTYPSLSKVRGRDWLFILIIAVVSGVVSLFIYYKGLEHTKASVATLAELGFPMAAVMVNWFFLKATLNGTQLLGMLILLLTIFKLAQENSRVSAPEAIAQP